MLQTKKWWGTSYSPLEALCPCSCHHVSPGIASGSPWGAPITPNCHPALVLPLEGLQASFIYHSCNGGLVEIIVTAEGKLCFTASYSDRFVDLSLQAAFEAD